MMFGYANASIRRILPFGVRWADQLPHMVLMYLKSLEHWLVRLAFLDPVLLSVWAGRNQVQ
jgi:hypothetical protein